MSIIRKTFREGSWLALFKLLSQSFSWVITIIVARVLTPDDYGLMAVSFIIIGYAKIFSELGLGAAIIQKPEQTQEELSSVFWFALGCSLILFIGCYIVAYPAALLFKNHSVTPIMQAVSVTFVLSGLQIVPSSLLRKRLEFKKFGAIDLTVTFVSSIAVLIFALNGAGVWALVWGHIIMSLTRLIMIFLVVKWIPMFFFDFKKAKSYIKFGLKVSLSRTLFYVNENSDTFIAGRAWSTNSLGYYSFALQLSKIPMDRIISLIHQVSFPLFSGLQKNKQDFNNVYIHLIKLISSIVLPIYVGGFMVGDELVRVLLDEQWHPMITLFRYLCLAQIIASLSAINNRVHTSQGRPFWGVWYHGISATLMPISFYFAVQFDNMEAILIPWFTTYLAINFVWIMVTIKKLDITLGEYFKSMSHALSSTVMMAMVIQFFNYSFPLLGFDMSMTLTLGIKVIIGALMYMAALWYLDRTFFTTLRNLRTLKT